MRQPPSPPLEPSSASDTSSPPGSPNQSSSAALHPNMTMDSEHSFAQPRPSSLGGPSRGGAAATRGRGTRGRGRGGANGAMTRKKKEELAVSSDTDASAPSFEQPLGWTDTLLYNRLSPIPSFSHYRSSFANSNPCVVRQRKSSLRCAPTQPVYAVSTPR